MGLKNHKNSRVSLRENVEKILIMFVIISLFKSNQSTIFDIFYT